MIVTCPNCTTRLQLEASKIPSRAFSIRCPKCQHIVTAQPPAQSSQRDAVAAGGDGPASARQQTGASAPAVVPTAAEPQANEVSGDETDVLRLLASLLKREGGAVPGSFRQSMECKRALVCMG